MVSQSDEIRNHAASSARNFPTEHAIASEFEVVELLEGLLEGFRAAGAVQPLATGPQQAVQAVTEPVTWRPPMPAVTGRPEPVMRETMTLAGPQQPTQAVNEPRPWRSFTETVVTPAGPQQAAQISGPLPWRPGTSTREPVTPGGPQEPAQTVAEPLPWKHAQPVSEVMRRHALKAFMEKTCGSVANGFDVLAGRALRSTLGGSGTPQDRLRYTFTQDELSKVLGDLGYGIGATSRWWHELFSSLDVDCDGFVSLQDTYDALVLQLPTMPDSEPLDVFFDDMSSQKFRDGAPQRWTR